MILLILENKPEHFLAKFEDFFSKLKKNENFRPKSLPIGVGDRKVKPFMATMFTIHKSENNNNNNNNKKVALLLIAG